MDKQKIVEEIKTVLKNNITNHEYYSLDFDNNYVEYEITDEISLEILIKIQKELPNYKITLSGNYNCKLNLYFELL